LLAPLILAGEEQRFEPLVYLLRWGSKDQVSVWWGQQLSEPTFVGRARLIKINEIEELVQVLGGDRSSVFFEQFPCFVLTGDFVG
jgi:hypothetical protein